MTSSNTTSDIKTTLVNKPASSTYIRLPRELRDLIYNSVLADAGTLVLGLPPPHAAQDNNPRMEGKSAEKHGSTSAAISLRTSMLVDIRLQQQITPLSLLGVSRGTRQELLVAMARYVRRQGDVCFFRLEPDALTLRNGGVVSMRPMESIKNVMSDINISWSHVPRVLIGTLCTLLKWQISQGMLVRDIEFLTSGPSWCGNVPEVRWKCRTPEAHGHATDVVSFRLWFLERAHFGEYELTITTPDNAGRCITLYHKRPVAAESPPMHIFLMEEGNLGNGMILNAHISRCYRVLDKYSEDNIRLLVTPADVLSFKVREAYGRVDDEDAMKLAGLGVDVARGDRNIWIHQAISFDWRIISGSR